MALSAASVRLWMRLKHRLFSDHVDGYGDGTRRQQVLLLQAW